MINLPEARNAVFVQSTPGKFLSRLGFPTQFVRAKDADLKLFGVKLAVIDLDERVAHVEIGDTKIRALGHSNIPVEISPIKIRTLFGKKSLVFILD